MSEKLSFGSGGERDLSILLLKQFYGTFNGVCWWSNRFWQRQMWVFSATWLKMQQKWSKAVFTDSHLQWCTATVHVQPGRVVSLFRRKMKSDSCFIARMCQDICLSSTEPLGEYFACCFIFFFPPFFFPTSAPTSPSAVFLFSLWMNWNKYHLWERARASLELFFLYWKRLITLVVLHLNLYLNTVTFLPSPSSERL